MLDGEGGPAGKNGHPADTPPNYPPNYAVMPDGDDEQEGKNGHPADTPPNYAAVPDGDDEQEGKNGHPADITPTHSMMLEEEAPTHSVMPDEEAEQTGNSMKPVEETIEEDKFQGFINSPEGGGGFLFKLERKNNGAGESNEENKTEIKDVWVDDVGSAFHEIQNAICCGGTFFVGLDTEFCRRDGVLDPKGAPTSEEQHYLQATRIVNGGDLLQIGIVLGNEHLDVISHKVFQFNLLFDQSSRNADSSNLKFIRDVANLDLYAHATRGIPILVFFRHLKDSGLIGSRMIAWITYQGYSDFGYLIRGIQEVTVLPERRSDFLAHVRRNFPRSYDLKVFHELGVCCRPPPPMPRPKGSASFQAMANGLEVQRTGDAHGAGSDAHLTLLCFKTMILGHPLAATCLSEYRSTVYGVGESLQLPWDDNDATEVSVKCNISLEREARIFTDLFATGECCQQFVSVEVSFGSGDHFSAEVGSYAITRTETWTSGPVEVGLAVSDKFGCLAFGRVWSFVLGNENHHIQPSQLTRMLTSTGVILNPNVTWSSSSSKSFVYLVKALSSSECLLPLKLPGFFALTAAYFPNFHVLRVMSEGNRPGHRALITLRQFQAFRSRGAKEGWLQFYDMTD